jgi:hypothetical protein
VATEGVTVPASARLEKLGDRIMAVPLTFELSGMDRRPDLEMSFDVIDGELQCREVRLTASGDRAIRQADLREVNIGNVLEIVAKNFSMPASKDGLVTRLDLPVEDDERRDALRNYRAAKRRTDNSHLERVAEIYLGADHAPTKAVAEAFDVAHRTAGLYVQRAREANLIPPAASGRDA